MAITHLGIEGFRSLKRVEWSPAPLNVLIGPNGSGKSNVLRALRLLQSAAEGGLNEAVLSAGGMGALVWDSHARRIAWHVGLQAMSYKLVLDRIGTSAEYVISDESLYDSTRELFRRRGRTVTVHGQEAQHLPIDPERDTALPLLAFNEDIRGASGFLRSIAIYHDLNVHEDAALRQAAIARREFVLSPNGQNLIAVLHTLYSADRDFRDTLNSSMRTAFSQEFDELTFPPASDQRVDMRIRWRSLRTEQSTASLSDGTLRFLMLVAILATPSRRGVIAIDEPELGLHPNMLPIIAELAQRASEHTQVIFTTHSPQFLDAFAEPPATTVVTLENGESKLEMLSGNDLAAWLERYTLGELFRSGELEAMV